jgi:hypothetical protein
MGTTTVEHPSRIIIICAVLQGPGPPPPVDHDMKWALSDCELFSNPEGNQELHMVRYGIHLVIVVPNISRASKQTLVLRLEGKIMYILQVRWRD